MSNLDDIFQNHDQKRSKRQNPREHFNLCICSQKQEFNVILKIVFQPLIQTVYNSKKTFIIKKDPKLKPKLNIYIVSCF
jgi:hypothetical protein